MQYMIQCKHMYTVIMYSTVKKCHTLGTTRNKQSVSPKFVHDKDSRSRTTLVYSFLYFFFILYMYLSIYIISLLNVYSHFSRIPSLLLLIFQIHKLLHGWGARHIISGIRNNLIFYRYILLLSTNTLRTLFEAEIIVRL